MLSSSLHDIEKMCRNSFSSYYYGTFECIWSLNDKEYNRKNLNGNLEVISRIPNFHYLIKDIKEFDYMKEVVIFRWALLGYIFSNLIIGLYFLRRIYISQEKYYHSMPISSIVQGSMVEINLFLSALFLLEGYFLYFCVIVLFTLGLFCPFVPFLDFRFYEDRTSAPKYGCFMIFLGLLVVLNIAGLIFYDFFIPLSVALIPVVGAMDYFYWNKKARKVNEIIILTSLRSFIPFYVFFYSGNFDSNPGTLGYDFYLVLTFGVAAFNILWLQ